MRRRSATSSVDTGRPSHQFTVRARRPPSRRGWGPPPQRSVLELGGSTPLIAWRTPTRLRGRAGLGPSSPGADCMCTQDLVGQPIATLRRAPREKAQGLNQRPKDRTRSGRSSPLTPRDVTGRVDDSVARGEGARRWRRGARVTGDAVDVSLLTPTSHESDLRRWLDRCVGDVTEGSRAGEHHRLRPPPDHPSDPDRACPGPRIEPGLSTSRQPSPTSRDAFCGVRTAEIGRF